MAEGHGVPVLSVAEVLGIGHRALVAINK